MSCRTPTRAWAECERKRLKNRKIYDIIDIDKSEFTEVVVFLDTNFLESDEIKLILEKTTEADPVKNWVPAYHFFDLRPSRNCYGALCAEDRI